MWDTLRTLQNTYKDTFGTRDVEVVVFIDHGDDDQGDGHHDLVGVWSTFNSG